MLNIAVSFTVYLVEMLIAYAVFSSIGEKKYASHFVFIIGIVLFGSGALVNTLFSNTVWINVVYTLVINTAFAKLGFHISFRSSLLFSVLMDFFSLSFEVITVFIVLSLLGSEATEYNSNMTMLVIEISISKLLYFISCVTLLRVPKTIEPPANRISFSFYLYPLCTLFAFLTFWYICDHENLSDRNQALMSYTSIALLLSTVILFITYRHNLEKENEFLHAKNELESLQTQKEYYDILEHQNQQLMIYAHDAKKHMAAIQNLSTDADIQGYVQELSDQLKSYTSSCHSGNKTLDVIINRYQTECDIHGIAFEYDVKPCNLNNMEDVDLVSVLGNLMDNALDAAKKSSGKHLLLATTWRNDYSVIIVSNSCDTAPATIGNRLLTSKEDRKLHGFGLKSVRNTLKKYSGDFDWEYDAENHVFTITAMVGKKS